MNLKKIFAFLLASTTLFSCSKESFTPEVKITSDKQLTVEAYSHTIQISVSANQTWTVSSDVEWLTPKISGKTITDGKQTYTSLNVDVADNVSEEGRSGKICISSQGLSDQFVTVSQKGNVITFTIKDEDGNPVDKTLSVSSKNSSTKLSVSCNVDWGVSSDSEWLSVSPSARIGEKTSLTLSWEKNTKEQERSALVTFMIAGAKNYVLTVTQEALPPFSVEITAISVSGYLGEEDPLHPDDKNCYTHIGMPSEKVVSGYTVIAKKSEVSDLIDNWDKKFGEIKQYITNKGQALSFSDLSKINELEDESNMAWWLKSGLNPDTEYAFMTYLTDENGRNLEAYALHKTAEPKEIQWNLIGKGKYKDGLMVDYLVSDTKEITVEIYVDSNNANHYAVKNPYGPEMIAGWLLEEYTKEQVEAMKGTVWEDVYFEFTIDPSTGTAYVPYQYTGYIDTVLSYGKISAGISNDLHPDAKGYFSKGVVTIDQGKATIRLGNDSYDTNIGGSFKITLPAE